MLQHLKTIALLGVLSASLVGVGAWLAPQALPILVVVALLMNAASYWFSDRLVLAMHGARELPEDSAPEVHRMVEELAHTAGLPKPRVYLIPDSQPNAFATGRDPQNGVVAVTEGLLALLSPRELRGVLAHELAHIGNRDILVASVAAALASGITGIAHAVGFAAMFAGSSQTEDEEEGGGSAPASGLVFALLAPIAATIVQLAISRSREFLADETAARWTGDPDALASALERLEDGVARAQETGDAPEPAPATASLFIVSPLASASRVLGLFSTHPPISERARRLRLMSRSPQLV